MISRMTNDINLSPDDKHASSILGNKKVLTWGGIAVGVPVAVVLYLFLGGFMARCDGAYPLAMKQVNSCKAVTEKLGEPVEQKLFGRSWGSSSTSGGQSGTAQWSIAVAGPNGSGRYSYAAELHGGAWQVLRASLEVEDKQISVLPCGGEWMEKSIEKGKTSKPLLQAFGEKGTVAAATGKTSVKAGDSCDVSVTPNAEFGKGSPYNCRVVVKCGPKVLYGWESAGYTNCETEEGMPTTANDPWGTATDSDPIVEVDLPRNRVVVRDDNPASTYTIEITWPAPGQE